MNRTSHWFIGSTVALGLLAAAASIAEPPATVEPATVASAATRSDHEAIASAYDVAATRLDEQAAAHAQLAKIYGDYHAPKLYSADMERHCRDLARDLQAGAELNRKLAAIHRKIAAELSN
jgi:hypothetical protein